MAGAGSPGAGSRRHRRSRGRRHLPRRHQLLSSRAVGRCASSPSPPRTAYTRGPTRGRPLTRSAPFVHVACCGFSPARGGSAGTRRHTPRGSPSAPPLHDPNPGPPTLDLSLALRLTLRLTLTLINPNLDPRPNPNPDPEPDPNQALPGPGPASYSPVTAHPPPPRLHATKKPHHLVASAVNVDG